MSNEEKGQAESGTEPIADPKPAKTPAEKKLEKELAKADAARLEMQAQLEHMQALVDSLTAKTEELSAKVAAPPAPSQPDRQPAEVLAELPTERVKSITLHSRGGMYLLRNNQTDKLYQFQRLFPGGPALAMTEHGQMTNVNNHENGESGVTFFRGFLRVTEPGDIDYFREQAARDFNLRIAKVEVA